MRRTTFAESAFWKAAAGRFATPVAQRLLPRSLLERFEGDERERLVATLRFLSPITTSSASGAAVVETAPMSEKRKPSVHERWALLRFSVVGPLLASPPYRGDLHAEIERLAARLWRHPVREELTRFGVSTIERWFYQAHRAQSDPVGALRKKVRRDAGSRPAMGEKLRAALIPQHGEHRSWSYQLHHDNLRVLAEADPSLGPPAS